MKQEKGGYAVAKWHTGAWSFLGELCDRGTRDRPPSANEAEDDEDDGDIPGEY